MKKAFKEAIPARFKRPICECFTKRAGILIPLFQRGVSAIKLAAVFADGVSQQRNSASPEKRCFANNAVGNALQNRDTPSSLIPWQNCKRLATPLGEGNCQYSLLLAALLTLLILASCSGTETPELPPLEQQATSSSP
ncbi:MAG: hypothetical protein FWH22_08435, partial [Fibromonadales bacterium]|nr:hypothetical protein [Fibromonadales bacterium]